MGPPTRLVIRDAGHARVLFPLLHRSPVLDTLYWDGPEDAETLERKYAEHGEQTRRGEAHEFTVVDAVDALVGCLSVRPGPVPRRGDFGLLIVVPHQGRGHGTRAVALALDYAFEKLGWEKAEAGIFVGNTASRRIFERNGFALEGTIRKSVCKRGVWRDEWSFGITREEWSARRLPQ